MTDHEDTVYIDWDFRPYTRVRSYVPENGHFLRENVFVSLWQREMTKNAVRGVFNRCVMREDQWFIDNESWRYPIRDVFRGGVPSLHDTRIASNFILFLGSGNGRAYLEDAGKLSKIFETAGKRKSEAYLSQWMIDNSLESRWSLMGQEPRKTACLTDQGDLFFTPRYRDLQTLESMAYWCGSDAGQKFLLKCSNMLHALQKRYYPPETDLRVERRHRIIQALNFAS